jgi:TRAP transporter TAXI family solute receptor
MLRSLQVLSIAATLAAPWPVAAAELRFHRIGTGEPSSTAFAVGTAVAAAISRPPGALDCERGGSCGVPGLVAVALSTAGSVANVNAVAERQLDSAFVQSDIATWAANGVEIFRGRPKRTEIRAIAGLFPEYVHLVARKGAGIDGIVGLRGKRVAVDVAGSGTLVVAGLIFQHFGLPERSLTALKLAPGPAADMLANDEIDALFFVGGVPAPLLDIMIGQVPFDIVPISGRGIDRLTHQHRFLSAATIPAGVYEGYGEIPTIGVGTQWIVHASADEETVYQITKALWHPANRRTIEARSTAVSMARPDLALAGLTVPLHAGAERYYREAGLRQ